MRHYLFCLLMALPLCFTACSSDNNDNGSTENNGKKYLAETNTGFSDGNNKKEKAK